MLREQAAGTPKGPWVRVVGGWSAERFAERRLPTGAELNAADTYLPVMDVVKEHGGTYGLGVVHAQAVIGEHAAG